MGMAWKNIKSRKYSSIKVIISMVIMILILCIFTTYSVALADETSRIINSYRAGHYYVISEDEKLSDDTLGKLKKIENVEKIDNYAVYTPSEEYKADATENFGYTMEIDGKIYTNSANDNYTEDKFSKIAFYDNKEVVANNEVQEFKYRWLLNGNIMKQGNSVLASDSVIISEKLIEELNMPTDCYGKNVSIKKIDGTKIYDGKITGILDSRYYELTDHKQNPHLIMNSDNESVQNILASNKRIVVYETKIFIKNYLVSQQVARDMLTTAGIVRFRTGSDYGLAMASTSTIVGNVLTGAMSTIGVAIIAALIINILISMRYIIAKKSNYYGIIMAYGMKRQKILSIMFCEMLIISFISIIAAYMISYAITYALDAVLKLLINFGVIFTWYNFLITLSVALVFTISVAIIVTAINYSGLSKKSSIKLLKYGLDR